MNIDLRNFELKKEQIQLQFASEYATSSPADVISLTRIFHSLSPDLRSLPFADSTKATMRDAYSLDDGRIIYILREMYRPDSEPTSPSGISLYHAVRQGIFGADPRLYVHMLDDEIVVSEVAVPLQDRVSGRDAVKHLDLTRGRAPAVICAGEIYVAFAGKNRERIAVTISNKSGSFLPYGRSLADSIVTCFHIYSCELCIGLDYESRTISVHHCLHNAKIKSKPFREVENACIYHGCQDSSDTRHFYPDSEHFRR